MVGLVWVLTNRVLAVPTLTWEPNPEPDISGYAVYYSDLTAGIGGRWDAGLRNDLPLVLEAGHQYVFSVTAYSESGLESAPSAPLNYTAAPDPAPPDAPSITAQPLSQAVVLSDVFSVSISATGAAPLTYQWFRNGVELAGATSSSYLISSVQRTSEGSYTVRVSNPAGSATSSAAVLTVISPPTISTQPASSTVAPGSAVTFSVTAAGGNGTISYQWFRNAVAVSGATSASYSIGSVQAADAATYSVRVWNAAGSVTSSGAILTVIGLPSITGQPLSRTVSPGSAVSFSVTATGTGTLSYQWLKNGTLISGAISSSYSIGSVQERDAASYAVRVSNAAGSMMSSAAVLTVIAAPTILIQPLSQTVNPASPFILFVQVDGTAPLTYRWFRDGQLIPLAAESSYEIAAAAEQDAGSYSVEVSNAAGTVTSSPAVVTVADVVTISTQPASQTVNAGSVITFSVTATGSGTLSYQWFKNGVEIPGATSSSYSISSVQKTDSASYTVRVTNARGTVASSPAVLTVISAPSISAQPLSQAVNIGSAATFSVTATAGNSTLSYQWLKNGVEISGAASSTYSINSARETDAASYIVRISNTAGTVTSLEAILTVVTPPTISAQPLSQTVKSGDPFALFVEAHGTGPLTYRWLKNGQPIPGAAASRYEVPAADERDAGSYSVEISNVGGRVVSEVAVITMEVVETRLDLTLSETSPNTLQFMLSGEPGTYEVRRTTNITGSWTSILSTNISGPTQVAVPLGTAEIGFFRMVRIQN